jgi:hypothetical protein
LAGAVGGVGVTFIEWLLPRLARQDPLREYVLAGAELAFFLVPFLLYVAERLPPERTPAQMAAGEDLQGQWFARVATRFFAYAAVLAVTYAALSLIVLHKWPEIH